MQTEKVVETKQCKNCNTSFDITDKDLEFYEKVSPVFGTPPNLPLSGEELEQTVASSPLTRGELRGVLDLGNGKAKYLIPTPTLCTDCRQQRRLSFRNERKLYKNKCKASGKDVISLYSADKPYVIYNQKEWWSDKWNPLDYGRDFDFSRPFFEQFDEMMKVVPQISLFVSNNENSEYTNYSESEKNCYLVFASNRNEDCFYSSMIWDSKNCMDCYMVEKSQNCYELVEGADCFNVDFSQKVYNSSFCNYVYDCEGCSYCYGCSGLRNKKYHILNKPFSKQEYEELIKDKEKILYIISNYKTLKEKQFRLYENINNCENVTGGNLMNCKNCINCFDSFGLEDSKNVENSPGSAKNNHDVSGCASTELSYEIGSIANGYHMLFSGVSYLSSSNQIYSMYCHNSSNMFGCVSVRNKEYCILNKQYTKEEYEKLVPKIIEHMMKPLPTRLRGIEGEPEWGEFFPIWVSPFGYNETQAYENFPLTKFEAKNKGYKWKDEEEKEFKGTVYIPMDIGEYNKNLVGEQKANENMQNLLNGILLCNKSKKPFKIIKQELDFYIKNNLQIPSLHPDIRHENRMKLKNPKKLYDRKCDKCGIEIKTTYSQERKEIVYCEKCYNKEIY